MLPGGRWCWNSGLGRLVLHQGECCGAGLGESVLRPSGRLVFSHYIPPGGGSELLSQDGGPADDWWLSTAHSRLVVHPRALSRCDADSFGGQQLSTA